MKANNFDSKKIAWEYFARALDDESALPDYMNSENKTVEGFRFERVASPTGVDDRDQHERHNNTRKRAFQRVLIDYSRTPPPTFQFSLQFQLVMPKDIVSRVG